MGKIEIILEKAYRGLSKFNDKLQENTIDLVYGTDNQQVEMLNADFFS